MMRQASKNRWLFVVSLSVLMIAVTCIERADARQGHAYRSDRRSHQRDHHPRVQRSQVQRSQVQRSQVQRHRVQRHRSRHHRVRRHRVQRHRVRRHRGRHHRVRRHRHKHRHGLFYLFGFSSSPYGSYAPYWPYYSYGYGPSYYAEGEHRRFPAFRMPAFFQYPGALAKGEDVVGLPWRNTPERETIQPGGPANGGRLER